MAPCTDRPRAVFGISEHIGQASDCAMLGAEGVVSSSMVHHSFLAKKHSVVVHNTDVSDRAKLITLLRERFGSENVIPISNYNTFKLKTLIKDVGKFYGVPFEETNAATRTVEAEVRKAVLKHGDDKNLFVLKFDDAMQHSPSFKAFIDAHPEIAAPIATLFKQPRSLGRHAGGVIVCDHIAERMPLIASKGEQQTPWTEGVNVKELDQFGWIKFDLLGLDTLRIVEKSIELILERQRRERGWFEIVTDEGTTKAYGDQPAMTRNRGTVLVRDLVPGDDVVSVGQAQEEADGQAATQSAVLADDAALVRADRAANAQGVPSR